MQIAVLGLGRFGSELVRSLASLGHEVLAVDLDEARVQRAAPTCAKAAEGRESPLNAQLVAE